MPAPLSWFQVLAQRTQIAYQQTGLPSEFAAEQFFALQLGQQVESGGSPQVNSQRLLIYRPVLRTASIEEASSREQQLEVFFTVTDSFVAVTKRGRYLRLLTKIAGLEALVKAVIRAESDQPVTHSRRNLCSLTGSFGNSDVERGNLLRANTRKVEANVDVIIRIIEFANGI